MTTTPHAADGVFRKQFDQAYTELTELIKDNGWAMVSHLHPAPPLPRLQVLTYSVGLTERGKPELAVESATVEGGRAALNTVVEVLTVPGAPPLEGGQLITVPGWALRADYGAPRGWFPHVTVRYTFGRVALLRTAWPGVM